MDAEPGIVLRANLEALSPVTRQAIEAAVSDDVVQVHAEAAGVSASIKTPDGRWLHLHSQRAPVAEADGFVNRAFPDGPPPVVIVIGAGLGYVLEAIERRSADTKVMVIEPFPAVARAMLERRDWTGWIGSERLTLLLGPDYAGAPDASKRVGSGVTPAIVEQPVVKREFPAEVARARSVAERLVRGAQANDDARKQHAGRYLLNTLSNLPSIVSEGDVAALADLFTGVPAIVVGAGPSLDDNLPALKALAGRVLIIAVDTTLRSLLAAGIRPHLVVALDPSELNALHLLGVEDTAGSWLVTEGSIDRRVLPEFAGHAFIFKVSDHHPWPWLREHESDRGTLRAWGSVLTSAFDLACHVGCNPIVFAGSDLAYTNRLIYCRNTIFEGGRSEVTDVAARVAAFADSLSKRETLDVPDIHGRPILTTPFLLQFRDWLVSRSEAVTGRRILNATGAGILHGGAIRQIDLASLEPSARDVPASARLASVWQESAAHSRRAIPRIEDALAMTAVGIPLHEWLDFAGDTASAEQIVAATKAGWRTAPAITEHPASVSWEPGSIAAFTVVARGGPRPAVQWQMSPDGGSSWIDIPGATELSYSVTIGAGDGGKQFRALLTNRHGSATTSAAAISAAMQGVVYDFDGDGAPDILWRNPLTGANVVWYMRGTTRIGRGVLPTVPELAFVLGGAGDFTGDGTPNILWRYLWSGNDRGHNGLWHMDGVTLLSGSAMEAEPDLAWSMIAASDFTGDGRPDILWRNGNTGANRIWHMDGLSRIGSSWLDTEPDLAWAIVGIGDFNGDGRPDILWRHLQSGANRVWYMDGSLRLGADDVTAEPDLEWKIVGAGDFNGDGKPDILWHNDVTGANRVWFMDGVERIDVADLDLSGGD